MPDSPNFLSVEQREKMLEGHSLHCGVRALVASHAEADRREAELREQQERLISVGHEWATIALQRNVDINELREQLAALRNSVLNQTGDDACWIPDPEHAQLPPKEEFLKSCERFHAQRTAQDGTLSGCMTIAQLEQQLAAKDAEITGLEETLFRTENKRLQLSRENERLRAALKAADRELINAVCDGAYYKPDETRMEIFRDGLREALAATPPANLNAPLEGQLVFVHGGVAQFRQGKFYTGMEDPRYERAIEWPVNWWWPIDKNPCMATPPATPSLDQLIEVARRHVITPEEHDKQVRSFAYGNVKISNQDVTREDVDRAVDVLATTPAKEEK